MITAEKFLVNNDSTDIFVDGPVYCESSYSTEAVIKLLNEFAKLVQEEQIKLCNKFFVECNTPVTLEQALAEENQLKICKRVIE